MTAVGGIFRKLLLSYKPPLPLPFQPGKKSPCFDCVQFNLVWPLQGVVVWVCRWLMVSVFFFWSPIISTLSSCMHAVVALLYPFSWQHTFIPVLPGSMLDIVCCPTPFLVGLLSSSLPKLKELPVEEVRCVFSDYPWEFFFFFQTVNFTFHTNFLHSTSKCPWFFCLCLSEACFLE